MNAAACRVLGNKDMCGRITQVLSPLVYAREMGWEVSDFDEKNNERSANWNIPPGSTPFLMHTFNDGKLHIDTVYWGYRPLWAAEKNIPPAFNAKIEKASTGAFFRPLWKSGRAIVPANGWYEWVGEKGRKQPWYIRLKNNRPMCLAALTNFRPGRDDQEGVGFVIVTTEAEGGMVDVHDRRPIVFLPKDAQLWMDNSLPFDQAEQLARSVALPSSAFEWYEVSRAVNKVSNNGPHLIDPLSRGEWHSV
jgi:putative SOS response-associated peptidase YedK